ncbi:MAG: glycerol-3-phosphate acyltransferase, partial [Candidatus Omnitrophica bacterium]|nr:glycerol-3-phosphate acyltransferase [Candidatus Omnitrophota bacterium]
VVICASLFQLQEVWMILMVAFASVIGHNWTVFLQFKGGKGIATSLGALIGLTIIIQSIRIVVLLTVLAWIGCFFVTRIVSIASIFASVMLPLLMIATNQALEFVVLGILLCIFVVVRHKANIGRLFKGQEPQVNFNIFRSSKDKKT